MKTSKLFIILFILSASPFFVFEALAVESQDVAASAVDQAEDTLGSTYTAILEAEQVGANVSDLLITLNNAVNLLAKARVAYVFGNFDQAVIFANLCSELGESAEGDLVELTIETQKTQATKRWFTLGGSLISVAAVVVFGFLGWGYIKRRYVKKSLKMRPEGGKDSEH